MQTAAELLAQIEAQREQISNSNLPPGKKKELLKRLAMLQPQEDDEQAHASDCSCGYCEVGFTSQDTKLEDPAIAEVINNFSNPIIPPKIMNSKVTAFVVIGVGIVLTVIGIKMMRKKTTATA